MLDLDKLICEGFELKLSLPRNSERSIPCISGNDKKAAPFRFSVFISDVCSFIL